MSAFPLPVIDEIIATNDKELLPPEQPARHDKLLLLRLIPKQFPLPSIDFLIISFFIVCIYSILYNYCIIQLLYCIKLLIPKFVGKKIKLGKGEREG